MQACNQVVSYGVPAGLTRVALDVGLGTHVRYNHHCHRHSESIHTGFQHFLPSSRATPVCLSVCIISTVLELMSVVFAACLQETS
jgi:hypothetical protein